MEHLGASEQGTGQPREKVAARGAPGTGGWKEGRPEAQEFKDSDRVTGGTRAGSHRVGYAPQEHAHQRVSRPEHLHLLLHEMLFLFFSLSTTRIFWFCLLFNAKDISCSGSSLGQALG